MPGKRKANERRSAWRGDIVAARDHALSPPAQPRNRLVPAAAGILVIVGCRAQSIVQTRGNAAWDELLPIFISRFYRARAALHRDFRDDLDRGRSPRGLSSRRTGSA